MEYIITKNREYFSFGNYNFCELEDMKLPETLAYDSETTGLAARHNEIFCCQIGTGKNNYIIHLYDDNYTFEDVIPYLKDRILIGHNLLFDLGFMYKHNFFPKKVKDTMLASKILYNGDVFNIKHDFGSVMKRELNVIYDKTDQKNISTVKLSQPSTIKYSFNDVDRLLKLHTALENKIKAGGYNKTYELQCRYIRALAYIEQCGLPISSKAWKEKMELDVKNTMLSAEEITEYIYDKLPKFRDNQIDMFSTQKRIKISLTSPIQMVNVFKALGINTLDDEGKDSINENIISKSKHEFVEMWLKFQESGHRVSTFGENIYKKIENERIYTNFNPMVDTSRISSRRGEINFLNFPADSVTRDCFQANTGNKMIVCDFSAQEGVIMADLSEDKAMTSSVVDGVDLHCLFAKVLFPELEELTDEEIIKHHKDKRQAAKVPRFLFSYGGNSYTLHVQEGIPLNRAIEIDKGFKELHAGLYQWGEETYQKSIKTGYIDSVDGWKLKLPKYDIFMKMKDEIESITKYEWGIYKEGKIEFRKSKEDPMYIIKNYNNVKYYREKHKNVSTYFKLKAEYFKLSLNNPVQTRAAHQLKLSTCLFFEWIEKENLLWKVKICNSPYDEIVAEAEEQYAEKTRIALPECMLKGGNHYLTNLKIQASANIGDSWYKAK